MTTAMNLGILIGAELILLPKFHTKEVLDAIQKHRPTIFPGIQAMYLAIARRRRVPWSRLSGTIQNDLLKEYVARGTYIFPPRPSMRLITDIFAYCKDALPNWNIISISRHHIREAGATAGQHHRLLFANTIAYSVTHSITIAPAKSNSKTDFNANAYTISDIYAVSNASAYSLSIENSNYYKPA
jgi:hypothetical protein